MNAEERFVDCDRCGERYVGEGAIRSYIREVEIPLGGVDSVCIGCLEKEAKEGKAKQDACDHPNARYISEPMSGSPDSLWCPSCGKFDVRD